MHSCNKKMKLPFCKLKLGMQSLLYVGPSTIVNRFLVYLYDNKINLPHAYLAWYPNLNKTVNTPKQIYMNLNDRTITGLNKFEKIN